MLESRLTDGSLKPKDLIGVPWATAFALQAAGWYLRDAIVWAKGEVDEWDKLEGSPMPGSQRDRCTFAYEMVFQLTKKPRYFFDQEAIKTKSGAIPRNVWRINPEPSGLAHFAQMPRELAARCIKAGSSERGCCPACGSPWQRVTERTPLRDIMVGVDGDRPKLRARQSMDLASNRTGLSASNSHNASTPQGPIIKTLGWQQSCPCPPADPVPCLVLDPFSGASTTGVVALALGRRYVGFDLSPDYLAMSRRRIDRPHAPSRKVDKHLPLFAALEDPA